MHLVPTLHPAFIARQNRKYFGVVLNDLRRAHQLLSGWRPKWDEHKKYILEPSVEAVEAWVERCIRLGRFFECDIETDGQPPQVCAIRCIGLYDGEHAICIPLLRRDGTFDEVTEPGAKKAKKVFRWLENYSAQDRLRVLTALQRLFTWADVPWNTPLEQIRVGGQNFQFDRLCMRSRLGLRIGPRYFDDLLAHHVFASMHPHSLAFIASLNTDVAYYKATDEGHAWSTENDEELWIYCCRDTVAQYQCRDRFIPNLRRRQEDVALYDFDLRLTNECETWKETGMKVDPVALQLYRDYYVAKAQRALGMLKACVRALIGGDISVASEDAIEELSNLIDASDSSDFKPGSLPQLRNACAALGIPLTHETDTGQLSTAKEFLLEARAAMLERKVRPDDPRIAFLDYLFAWREAAKIESTYLRPEILPDGRVHGTFHHGPPTGRLASSEPNIQNQPAEIRGMFQSIEDHSLVYIDWDAGELRLAALISGEQVLIKAFDLYDAGKGPKIHKVNGSIIFNVPIERLTDPLYRAAKVFAYAVLYGATEMTVFENVRKEMPDMLFGAFQECFKNFKKGLPTLFRWQESWVAQGTKKGFLDGPILGRREYFFERGWNMESPEASKMLNFPEQCTLADIVGMANFRVIDELYPKYRAKLKKGEVLRQLAQVHDELLFEVPDRLADDFMKDLKAVAERPTPQKPTWRMPVEAKKSKRWKPIPLEVFLAASNIHPDLFPDAAKVSKERIAILKEDLEKAADPKKKEKLKKEYDAVYNLFRRVTLVQVPPERKEENVTKGKSSKENRPSKASSPKAK